MKQEEITAIYWKIALNKILGITNHKITDNNNTEWIEIKIGRIAITLPISTDYKTIKRIIKKELEKYTVHKSITPKHYQLWNTKPILKFSKSDKTVIQEPLLDLYY